MKLLIFKMSQRMHHAKLACLAKEPQAPHTVAECETEVYGGTPMTRQARHSLKQSCLNILLLLLLLSGNRLQVLIVHLHAGNAASSLDSVQHSQYGRFCGNLFYCVAKIVPPLLQQV